MFIYSGQKTLTSHDLQTFPLILGAVFSLPRYVSSEAKKNVLILAKFTLSIFVVVAYALAVVPKTPSLAPRSERIASIFFSETFIVFTLTCR